MQGISMLPILGNPGALFEAIRKNTSPSIAANVRSHKSGRISSPKDYLVDVNKMQGCSCTNEEAFVTHLKELRLGLYIKLLNIGMLRRKNILLISQTTQTIKATPKSFCFFEKSVRYMMKDKK
jgi:hypothetical protein